VDYYVVSFQGDSVTALTLNLRIFHYSRSE